MISVTDLAVSQKLCSHIYYYYYFIYFFTIGSKDTEV